MGEWLATLAVSGAIVTFGAFFLLRHRNTIHKLYYAENIRPQQLDRLIGQQKRRVITSVLIILVGLLIPLSYDMITRLKNPQWAAILLLVILGLILNIVLLAVADLLTSSSLRAELQLKKAETDLKRVLLEKELEQHRSERASDAASDPNSP